MLELSLEGIGADFELETVRGRILDELRTGLIPLAVGVRDLPSLQKSAPCPIEDMSSADRSSSSRGVGGKGKLVVLVVEGDIELCVARLAADSDFDNGCD